jgi:hypothetical protein
MKPMSTVLNPSTISDEKVGRFFDLIRPEVKGLAMSDEDFQKHLIEGEKNLRIKSRVQKLLQEIAAEATNTMVVIAKRVDYDRDPMEVIRACGRTEYITESVVRSMPRRGKGVVENVPVVFYKLGRWVTVEESDKEEDSRILVPDPYALAAINEEDPAFADTYPGYCQWGRDGKVASYLAFDGWTDERRVDCRRFDNEWDGDWWRSGVRK